MALTKIDDRGLKTPIDLLDNEKIRFGTGNDLELYHDGSNSYITDTGTGRLLIKSSGVRLHSDTFENYLFAEANSSVELYYDNSKKLATESAGVAIWNGNIRIPNDTYKMTFGASADLQIWHDGSNSFIYQDGTGELRLHANTTRFKDRNGGEDLAVFTANGAVDLYYNNVKTFSTTTNGITVKGPEGDAAQLYLYADEGDDNADKWSVLASAGGTFQIRNYSTGSWVDNLIIDGSGRVGISTTNPDKSLTIGGTTPVIKLNDGSSRIVEIRGGSTSHDPSILSMYAANLYLGANSTLMSSFSSDGQITVKRHNSGSNSNYIDISAVKGSYWGYSGHGYTGLLVGSPSVAFNSTIFMGVDITGNTNGGFTGDGREIVFRNNHKFVIPNAANNGYLTPIDLNQGATTEGVPRFKQGCLFGTDTADANILDDYEEGDWTPAYGSALSSVTYNAATGRYTKVGNLVTVTARLQLTAATTSGNDLTITGLPFTASSSLARGGMDIIYQDNWYSSSGSGTAPIMLQINQSTTTISIWDGDGTATDADDFYDVKRHIQLKGFYYV